MDEEELSLDEISIDSDDENENKIALEAVEFGWEDERKVTGRRKKQLNALKRKTKPGTFGWLITSHPLF